MNNTMKETTEILPILIYGVESWKIKTKYKHNTISRDKILKNGQKLY
jgi:hypothetical protein